MMGPNRFVIYIMDPVKTEATWPVRAESEIIFKSFYTLRISTIQFPSSITSPHDNMPGLK